jgi:endonuclease/exonuclease/phosphatase (EEP) superfamily protein YafD
MMEFPRLQLAVACLSNLVLCAVLLAIPWLRRPSSPSLGSGSAFPDSRFLRRCALVHAACLAEHARKLHPYTPFNRIQSHASPAYAASGDVFTLLICNVLMSNRRDDRLRALIEREHPDLLLFLEPDGWWAERLAFLDSTHPWQVKVPRDNTYGMILLSRLPLEDARVEHRLHADVPSIHAVARLRSGRAFRLHCVHPRPPAEEHTEDRDAELYLVGRDIRRSDLPAVIAGDLNDVAWSRTTRLFQEVSGTLDPRVGRGFFNTFHADHPLLRYSLDHVFHTGEFSVTGLRRLEDFGSDHFPILVGLRLHPSRARGEEPPPPDPAEMERIRETIRKARSD